jgi:metal transporter CNNM
VSLDNEQHFKTVYANIPREIIDESDVFIDVHKAIRRMAPSPRSRVPRGTVVTELPMKPSEELLQIPKDSQPHGDTHRKLSLPESSDAAYKSFLVRRRSSGNKGPVVPIRPEDLDLYSHLKHLGPSNAANRPNPTRINTVKIKPGAVPDIPSTIPEYRPTSSPAPV